MVTISNLERIASVSHSYHDIQSFNQNGFEGHFYLTKLLTPALIAGSKITNDGPSRVINISSMGHLQAKSGTILFDTLKGDNPARKELSTQRLYAQSKFGNIVFSNEFARRYEDQGVISIALAPGKLNLFGLRT